jgi:glycosyltransferase involved in cell wall biosynthesis
VQLERLGDPSDTARLRAWKPDVLLAHGLADRSRERALLDAAPTAFVVHNYDGFCVSGAKAWAVPRPRPCQRTLGPGCLLHYFPHRCGGLSPFTMVRRYRDAQVRRDTLARCSRLVVLSEHMRRASVAHGADPTRVEVVPPASGPLRTVDRPAASARQALRLVFLGRLEASKGVFLLLASLPLVAPRLGRRLLLTVAGDGRDGEALRNVAARTCADRTDLDVRFTGWLHGDARDRLFDEADLFVFPSVWPEPFGLAGLEAASRGVPAAAFDIGGTREWLQPGVTGVLAPGDAPTAPGLANAIVSCLEDPARTRRLGEAAKRLASTFTPERHAAAMEDVLVAAAGGCSTAERVPLRRAGA